MCALNYKRVFQIIITFIILFIEIMSLIHRKKSPFFYSETQTTQKIKNEEFLRAFKQKLGIIDRSRSKTKTEIK